MQSAIQKLLWFVIVVIVVIWSEGQHLEQTAENQNIF